MTRESSLHLPGPVADEIDAIHRQIGRAADPKWRTVQRAVREMSAVSEGSDE